jgi:hypothetical protein
MNLPRTTKCIVVFLNTIDSTRCIYYFNEYLQLDARESDFHA